MHCRPFGPPKVGPGSTTLRCRVRLPGSLRRVSVEDGPAAWGERHLGLNKRALAPDLDEPADEGVLPDGVAGARAPPGVHDFGIGPPAACDPRKELEHQEADGLGHWSPLGRQGTWLVSSRRIRRAPVVQLGGRQGPVIWLTLSWSNQTGTPPGAR